jgi:glycine/D-amino acid oxidase-like deaminating enzyme/nitrite reductase/ring-hydroxylating ferredoxin subunit
MREPSAGSGITRPPWLALGEIPRRPPLERDVRADVCVVGGGISGLTIAYLLAREGRSVVLLDDGPLAGGETARTTAHLTCALDDRFSWIEKVHGERGAGLAAQSHGAAIDRIETIVREEGIDCGFERLDGFLLVGEGEDPAELEVELHAAHRAGLSSVERLGRAPVGSFDTGPCLRFPRQGQFHPLRYLAGLASAIERDGGALHSDTHAESIEGGSPPRVTTSRGPTVTAAAVVVATNSPVHTRFEIHTKQAPYRTYVIGLRVPAGAVTRALYWDTGWPYHYVRLDGSRGDAEELLIVGGEDHKTGQEADADARLERLEQWTRARFPMAGKAEYRWSGQVLETVDGLAFIGPTGGEENVYLATGDSGMGMTHGTIAGILLTDLIQGRENSWATLYDPARKSLRAAGELARENWNVAVQYADHVLPGESADAAEIPAGSGAVVRRGLRKLAVYRDEEGRTHERSAVCPHLGCVVAWNALEKSWDCPCHGSRFDRLGRVVNGPANRDLEPAD